MFNPLRPSDAYLLIMACCTFGSKPFQKGSAFENIVCILATIFSRPQMLIVHGGDVWKGNRNTKRVSVFLSLGVAKVHFGKWCSFGPRCPCIIMIFILWLDFRSEIMRRTTICRTIIDSLFDYIPVTRDNKMFIYVMMTLSNGPLWWGIHRSLVDSPHKGKWWGDLIFSLTWAWTNIWANNLIWDAIALIVTSL